MYYLSSNLHQQAFLATKLFCNASSRDHDLPRVSPNGEQALQTIKVQHLATTGCGSYLLHTPKTLNIIHAGAIKNTLDQWSCT
jgi:hypothetical protein